MASPGPEYYKVVALPNISAYSKEVRRGTFGFERCTLEDKKNDYQAAPLNVPKLTVLSAGVDSGLMSGSIDSGALSLPSIGASKNRIDRRKFHQLVRSSQEL